jgi:regulator of sigma D
MDDRQKKFRETSEELAQFFLRVGRIWKYDELKFLDLEPSSMSGLFEFRRLQLLEKFCAVELDYHIVSCMDYKVYNRLIPEAHGFYLACADNDPKLMVDLLARLTADEFLQIGNTMLAPVVRKVKGSI